MSLPGGQTLFDYTFIWKMVSGNLIGTGEGAIIPLEEQVKFMFKVSIFQTFAGLFNRYFGQNVLNIN